MKSSPPPPRAISVIISVRLSEQVYLTWIFEKIGLGYVKPDRQKCPQKVDNVTHGSHGIYFIFSHSKAYHIKCHTAVEKV